MAVASRCRNTNAQRHNKRHRHRSRGHTAGIKRYAQKFFGNKKRENKNHRIEADKQRGQRDAEQHTEKRHHKKHTDSAGNCENQCQIRNSRNLLCKHLQIRFRYCNNKAQQKRQRHNDPQFFGLCHRRADPFSHRGHCKLRAKREKHDSGDQQYPSDQKTQQNTRRNRRNRKG